MFRITNIYNSGPRVAENCKTAPEVSKNSKTVWRFEKLHFNPYKVSTLRLIFQFLWSSPKFFDIQVLFIS